MGRYWLRRLVIGSLVIVALCALIVILGRSEQQIDVNSGAIRNRVYFGPVLIWTHTLSTPFYRLRMKEGVVGVAADWRIEREQRVLGSKDQFSLFGASIGLQDLTDAFRDYNTSNRCKLFLGDQAIRILQSNRSFHVKIVGRKIILEPTL